MRQTITAIIVDDESLSRDNISHALATHPNWQVISQHEEARSLLVTATQQMMLPKKS